MRYKYLNKKDVLSIHKDALKTGDIDGFVSEGMLELAVESPERSVFGREIHDTLFRKAASLMHEIIKLSPFVDGNKRTGYLAVDTFLRAHGREIRACQQNVVDTCLKTSICSLDIVGITDWIQANSRRRRTR